VIENFLICTEEEVKKRVQKKAKKVTVVKRIAQKDNQT
jgi:hypothetical protein